VKDSAPLHHLVTQFTEKHLSYGYSCRRYLEAAEAFFENQWRAGTLCRWRAAFIEYLRASGFSFLRVARARDHDIFDLGLRLRTGSNVRGRALGYYGSSDDRLRQVSIRHLSRPRVRLAIVFRPQLAASARSLPGDCVEIGPNDFKRLFIAFATYEYVNEFLYTLSAIPSQRRQLNFELRARAGLGLPDVLAISERV
jgi:hypothetical protein